MTTMTREDRALIARAVGAGNPAAPELVLTTAQRLGPGGILATAAIPGGIRHELAAVVRRLLDVEQQLDACRRVLAEACALAADLPDDGLTADDLVHLLSGSGLDLRHDIEAAEAIRHADAAAGATW
jgi:hypothetical protein